MLHMRSLLVGIMTADGSATPNVPVIIGTQMQADDRFGVGSELSRMCRSFFRNNFANEMWCLPVLEPLGASAATGTITVSAPPTEAGTIHLYVGGQHLPINIAGTDTAEEVAQWMVDQIEDEENFLVSAEVDGTDPTQINLTANFKGVHGNDIRVELNYFGRLGGETLPIGLELTLPATNFLTGGVGVPRFEAAIRAMGEMEYDFVGMPYTDSTSLMAWAMEYGMSDIGRWGWMRQLFGSVFSARRGSYQDLIDFGLSRNDPVISVLAFEERTPTPMFEMTAAYVAKAQRALANDPARPLQTLQLLGCLPAQQNFRFNWMELNAMATSGLAIQKCWGGSAFPQIAREQTTYQLNLYGFGDDSWELVTTLHTLTKLIRLQRHAITSKYPRHKLANDGTRFGPGQAIVTPGIIKAELIAQYRIDEYNGLVEDARNFKRHLITERDPNNPNRLNCLYPPDLINQLRIFGVLAQFRLQYDRGIDVEIVGYGSQVYSGSAQGSRYAS